MKKPKIYLDTSVINFLFADDTPDFKKATIDFFDNYFSEYEVHISDIVLLEINKTNDGNKRQKLLKVIDDYPLIILEVEKDEPLAKVPFYVIPNEVRNLSGNKNKDFSRWSKWQNCVFKSFARASDERILILSDLYIKEKAIPKKKIEDAMHIAVCTVFELDILLSWNFKHLSNIHKEILINAINEKEGYWKKLNLMSPLEALYED